jgi:nicotinamidase-related amidase
MKALLIIDMQLGSFRPYTLRHDTTGVIERINELSKYFRANNDPVIFVQHDGTRENSFIPHTADWEILPELDKMASDPVISKTANDAFYKTHLQEILIRNNITELYITGCATDFCVDTTIKSALGKDYKVTVISDAHTTASRLHIHAEKVIEYYNWLWADMAPTKHKIRVATTSDVLNDFIALT